MLAANRTAVSVYTTPQPMQALGLALLVELILLAGLAIILANSRTVTPKTSAPVVLTIVSEPTPPKPIVKPVPIPPQPKSKVTPIHQAKPHPIRLAPPAPVPPVPLAQAPSPTAFSLPVTPPAPPQPPPPVVASTVDLHAEYADRVRAAVQAAVYYPPAAAAMHFSGRVQVVFHLRNGTPGEIRIITSSGLGIIDRAGLQAVQTAHYPAPPDDLRDKDLPYQVWVILTLTD